MRIGLIDVDGHGFPNLALMRISAYHKARGDDVDWWWSDFIHYDVVYMSKVFSDDYTLDVMEPLNADKIIKGGTGYAISIGPDGKEIFDQSKNQPLPEEIERCFPDYSIYPQHDFAVAMTSRGCPRACPFCHVAAKEGKRSVKIADVSDFWRPGMQGLIEVLDPNITACKDKAELFRQYAETGAEVNFNQGLDIRLLTLSDIEALNKIRLRKVHFAWDNPADDLSDKFKAYADLTKHRYKGSNGMVYVLTNFNSSMEQNLHRIYTLRDLGFDPFVMVYDKPHAPSEIVRLQRWCNNKFIFKTTPRFDDYKKKPECEEQYSLWENEEDKECMSVSIADAAQ